MRAGNYAVWRGREYGCVSVYKPFVRLLWRGEEPDEGGFERDHRGVWSRLVDRSEVSRLQSVETWAVWQGRRVQVVKVAGGRASVQQWQWPVPDHPAARAIENGLWGAKVPVEELTEVVETVTEVPIAL
ncbi:hypothetical protein GCM10011331_08880 [Flavimobilis marinus]|nr:hypothetical protein GCM10011331_08880 [Flavimobilis marinus]